MHFGDGGFPVTFTARSLEAKYIVEHTATREKTRIVMLDGMGEKKKNPHCDDRDKTSLQIRYTGRV